MRFVDLTEASRLRASRARDCRSRLLRRRRWTYDAPSVIRVYPRLHIADPGLCFSRICRRRGYAFGRDNRARRILGRDLALNAVGIIMADLVSRLNHFGPVRRLRTGRQPPISTSRLSALISRADAARDRRDWYEAARLYELVLQANPSSHGYRVQLGHAYKELGDFDSAGLNYQAVLRHTPLDDDLHVQIGHLEKLKGNLSEAAACYAKGAELNAKNTDALVEYYALAPKLGLPPLRFRSGQTEQARCTEPEDGAQISSIDTGKRTIPEDSQFQRNRPSFAGSWLERANFDRHIFKVGGRLKALFVSDSLGTPIHARGIYYYSTALAEILNDMGFEITLVIEKSPGYGLQKLTPKV